MQDMIQKGRANGGPPLENHNAQKVPEDIVKTIQELYESKTYTQYDLAGLFGLAQSTVWRIVRKKLKYCA